MATLFTLTLFLSAFLLFLVQPMLARMVLPLWGGTPAVWNTCMVFFQALLLAGYGYAHAGPARLGIRRHAILHVAVLLLPLLALPIAVPTDLAPPDTAYPMLPLLLLLLVTVGLPFFVLSASGPLLQFWFAATKHRRARDPYFLYAASNLGSMLALLGYPFLLEPRFGLARQSQLWAIGYCLLVLLFSLCAVVLLRAAPTDRTADQCNEPTVRLPWKRRLHWVLLAFVPSSLMLSVTTYLTQDIASIPLLWVLPLSLYLLTFILVFARRPMLPLGAVLRWMPAVVLTIVFVLLSEATEPVALLIAIHLLGLFWIGMACHGMLAADRPAVGYLTEFYVWLSVGGVLGGLFNALFAPLAFNAILEYPIILVLACLLRPAPARSRSRHAPVPSQTTQPADAFQIAKIAGTLPRPDAPFDSAEYALDAGRGSTSLQVEVARTPVRLDLAIQSERSAPDSRREAVRRGLDIALPLILGIATATIILLCQEAKVPPGPPSVALMFALPVVICYTFIDRPLRFSLGIAAVMLASVLYQGVLGKIEYRTRSFFGVHRVTRDPTGQFHVLAHGNTIHGQQYLAEDSDQKGDHDTGSRGKSDSVWGPGRRGKPLTYYYPTGPVGHLFTALGNDPRLQRVGIIGLGSGTMAAYARTGQHWTYFEIDPAVARIAQDPGLFTFYSDALKRGVRLDTVFGDARLTLARTDDRFGLIVIDAFSSDAIPVHLLTREALQVYLSRLQPGGLLAFNISNRYLDLEPVLASLAEDAGTVCLWEDNVNTTREEELNGKTKSQWAVMARTEKDLPGLRTTKGLWTPVVSRPGLRVWTDDYSNLFRVFRKMRKSE